MGSFRLEMFLDADGQALRSFEVAFNLEPDFNVSERSGSWHGLYERAKREGYVQTVWKGMEFEAIDRKEKGMQVVLRSPWPMPYSMPARPPRSRVNEADQLARHKQTRTGAWILARLVPGAVARFDPLYLSEGSWVCLPDRSVHYVRAHTLGARSSAEIMNLTRRGLDDQLIDLAKRELPKLAEFGVQINDSVVSWPSDFDPVEVDNALFDKAREAQRRTVPPPPARVQGPPPMPAEPPYVGSTEEIFEQVRPEKAGN